MDPGDLAAWAQVTGRPMTPLDNPRTTLDNEGGQAAAPIGTVPEVATPATPAGDRQTPANLGNEGRQGSAAIGTVLRFQRFRGTFETECSADHTASVLGVSGSTVKRARAVLDGPEVGTEAAQAARTAEGLTQAT